MSKRIVAFAVILFTIGDIAGSFSQTGHRWISILVTIIGAPIAAYLGNRWFKEMK